MSQAATLPIEATPSPSTRDKPLYEIVEYFEAGARRVWVVYPIDRQVYVYESTKKNRILGPGDSLEGEDVVPGFRLALDELFEDGA